MIHFHLVIYHYINKLHFIRKKTYKMMILKQEEQKENKNYKNYDLI